MNYKILINKDNPYNKSDFCNLKSEMVDGILLDTKTKRAYLELKKILEEKNILIRLKKMDEDYFGEAFSLLSFDILVDNNLDDFTAIFEVLKEAGLILRYPLGKEQITGHSFCPYHFRYVGCSSAKIIMDNNLTLEEYDTIYNKSGVLLVNKPVGYSSFQVVNKIGHIFDTKKIGHNGTLDPMAEGLLVVTINKATKINEFLTCEDKEYIASVKVGILTDTLDMEGKVLKRIDKHITKEMIVKLFRKFPLEYHQEVPIYSAIKIKGKKLYEYARNNIEVDLPKRLVKINEIQLLDVFDDSFSFRINVSKGTYIRSIIRDMGNMLGIPCTMASLQRTRQGKFLLKDAYEVEDIDINSKLISIKDALNVINVSILDEDLSLVCNGHKVLNHYGVKNQILFEKSGKIIGLYEVRDKYLIPLKMFK